VDRLPIEQFGLPNLTLTAVLLKQWLVACNRIWELFEVIWF